MSTGLEFKPRILGLKFALRAFSNGMDGVFIGGCRSPQPITCGEG